MYRVKRKKIKTGNGVYFAGDTFEVEDLGIEPGPKLNRLLDRLTRLDMVIEVEEAEPKSAPANKTKPVVIKEEIEAEVKTSDDPAAQLVRKGPWYFLPNGEKVKGKQAALDALAALSA